MLMCFPCVGIFYTTAIIGPAIGYIAGGKLLEVYCDVGSVDLAESVLYILLLYLSVRLSVCLGFVLCTKNLFHRNYFCFTNFYIVIHSSFNPLMLFGNRRGIWPAEVILQQFPKFCRWGPA